MSAAQKVELDPILTAQIVYEGATRMREWDDEEPTLREVIWFLIEEAAKVDKVIRKPGPARHVTMNMDHYWEAHEIKAAYNEALTELREAEDEERLPHHYYEPDWPKPTPDAMAHRRYLEVMGWLRFITAKKRSGQKRRATLILALARGMGGRKAMDVFEEEHFPSPRAVYAARDRALDKIEEAVRRSCRNSLALVA